MVQKNTKFRLFIQCDFFLAIILAIEKICAWGKKMYRKIKMRIKFAELTTLLFSNSCYNSSALQSDVGLQ